MGVRNDGISIVNINFTYHKVAVFHFVASDPESESGIWDDEGRRRVPVLSFLLEWIPQSEESIGKK